MKKNNLNDLSSFILNADATPTAALQEILGYFGINPHESLEYSIDQTQKKWLRPSGSERWELSENTSKKEQLYLKKLFKEVGIISAINPTQMQYDYFLYMGGDLPGMRERLAFMIKLWNQGIKANKIVFLTAKRSLDSGHESLDKIYNLSLNQFETTSEWQKPLKDPKTECELLQVLYSQAILSRSLRAVVPEFVNTPNIFKEGKYVRATTPDALLYWLRNNPLPGTCLVISSQPLIGYQESVTKTLLPPTFRIESAGPEAASDVTTAEYLDTLARWIYQEGNRLINAR